VNDHADLTLFDRHGTGAMREVQVAADTIGHELASERSASRREEKSDMAFSPSGNLGGFTTEITIQRPRPTDSHIFFQIFQRAKACIIL
jgi:hypothetical protein